MVHPEWDAFCLKCIPQEVQAQQPEINQNAQQRIPILYVPLRIFGCLGAVLEGVQCNNLLHFVHKLLHPRTLTQN